MGLFDKKFCDICGEKIGLLGNRKLEDGNLCRDCAKKLSPFFSDRRRSTVAEIRAQIESREQNRQALQSFNPTRILGGQTKVYIDPVRCEFCVSRRTDYREENADLINLAAVKDVRYEVQEERSEFFDKDAEGNEISYHPPRFTYSYEIRLYIELSHPYINEISFEVTDTRPDSRYTEAFRQYEQTANEIVSALRDGNPINGGPASCPDSADAPGLMNENAARDSEPDAAQYVAQGTIFPAGYQPGEPQQSPSAQTQTGVWFCPECGARNTGRFCPYCGTPKPF